MAYTDIDKPSDYFNTVLRSGLYGGSDTAFTVGFQPDLIWDKRRSGTSVHALFDSVRSFGSSGKVLYSNTSDAEATNGLIDSVNSTGFTIKASADNTGTLVDWCWKAGGTASSNTDGSITSTVSAGITQGMSIVSYTGNGSAGSTIGHGLNAVPEVVLIRRRNQSTDWNFQLGYSQYLKLNSTDQAIATSGGLVGSGSTSTITVDANAYVNASGSTYVGYFFVSKKGFSRFGSYVGNGSNDGSYIHLGFSPSFVLLKETSNANNWMIFDNKRSPFNLRDDFISPDISDAETTGNANNRMDMLSNGFKIRGTGSATNRSGSTFIYMAYAEHPFTTSTGIPTTAR